MPPSEIVIMTTLTSAYSDTEPILLLHNKECIPEGRLTGCLSCIHCEVQIKLEMLLNICCVEWFTSSREFLFPWKNFSPITPVLKYSPTPYMLAI